MKKNNIYDWLPVRDAHAALINGQRVMMALPGGAVRQIAFISRPNTKGITTIKTAPDLADGKDGDAGRAFRVGQSFCVQVYKEKPHLEEIGLDEISPDEWNDGVHAEE